MSSAICEIKEFFTKQKLIPENCDFGDSDSLLELGAIDSVGIQTLVMFLESKYGIQISEDDLMPENFDSILAIVNFVNSKRI